MTAQEALGQCVEAMKEVDFADCGKDDARWHKLNAAQQVAEEVLKRPVQEPVGIIGTQSGGLRGVFSERGSQWANVPESKTAMLFKDLPTGTYLYAAPVASQQAAAVNDDLPPLTMALHGTRKLLDEEIVRRKVIKELEPVAYKIKDSDGVAIVRLAEHVNPRRLIAVTVTPLYAHPKPAATPSGDVERENLIEALKDCARHPRKAQRDNIVKKVLAAITANKEENK